MPAPRNDKERDRIYEQAIALFLERGYTKTAYKDIAAACNTTKSMVQHYFPKKELLAERFFREKLDGFLDEAQALMPASYSQLDLLTCVGLLHYEFILNDPQAALLCTDILESRSLTSKVVEAEYLWAAKVLHDTTPEGTSMKAQITIALGGAYDLMHQAHIQGEHPTASSIQLAAMLAFWLPMGMSAQDVSASVRRAQKLTGIR